MNTPGLTIFSIPKPFDGEADLAQRNAINSWIQLAPFADIILLGDDAGVAEVAAELNVCHLPGVETNEHGTPKVSSAFAMARNHSTSDYLAFCNCDIILLQDFTAAIRRLLESTNFERFLATGQRTNIDLETSVDFSDTLAVGQLVETTVRTGQLESIMCKDFFVFPHDMFEHMPEFVVGRGNWDNWIIKESKQLGVPVVSVTECVMAVHQNHGYGHVRSRWDCYVNGEEARKNQELGAGRHWVAGSSFDYYLSPDSLRRNRMKCIAGDFWFDFPKAIRLVAQLFRNK